MNAEVLILDAPIFDDAVFHTDFAMYSNDGVDSHRPKSRPVICFIESLSGKNSLARCATTLFDSLAKNLENDPELCELIFQIIMNDKNVTFISTMNPVIHRANWMMAEWTGFTIVCTSSESTSKQASTIEAFSPCGCEFTVNAYVSPLPIDPLKNLSEDSKKCLT